ncbi:unnamed protein product [Adineta steineri]|uniref:Uncharacterized protein n=1 Tax=Adineta steineri TaxID=433720 RepID=A0A819ZKQ2_9BILA|nr:unnamed protein product [Adineta steineri]
MDGWNINLRFVDKENVKPQTFMCSECKYIFRDARGISPESSPQLGATQEPPCQNEEKPQEISSSPERETQEPFLDSKAGVTQEHPEPQQMAAPLPTHQEQLIAELEGRLLHYQEEIALLKLQWTEYKT